MRTEGNFTYFYNDKPITKENYESLFNYGGASFVIEGNGNKLNIRGNMFLDEFLDSNKLQAGNDKSLRVDPATYRKDSRCLNANDILTGSTSSTVPYATATPDGSESYGGLTYDPRGTANLDEPATMSKKEKEGKLFYELDFDFIKQMAEKMQANKQNSKYELWNWKKPAGEDGVKELIQAMWRHTLEVLEGRYEDDGREFGHLESVANNAMMITHQLKHFR